MLSSGLKHKDYEQLDGFQVVRTFYSRPIEPRDPPGFQSSHPHATPVRRECPALQP